MISGLSKEAAEHAGRYLYWLATLDDEAIEAEAERLSTTEDVDERIQATYEDSAYLLAYIGFYCSGNEADRWVERKRFEGILQGLDQNYTIARSLEAISENICDLLCDISNQIKATNINIVDLGEAVQRQERHRREDLNEIFRQQGKSTPERVADALSEFQNFLGRSDPGAS